jgi:peroxiredoxin (alkyl hydroperoxide reductase subunit C)
MKKEQKSTYCEHCGDFHDELPGEFKSSVRVGEPIPEFQFEALADGEAKVMKLSDLRGKWAVLFFYPADWSFVCPTELEEMAGLYPEFKKLGAEVVSFSTDTVYSHKAWQDASPAVGKVKFPMAADPSGKIAYAFGTLVEGGEAPLLESEGLTMRGTFIVDPQGTLRTMEIHDDAIGRSGKETLRKLKALQYVETHPGNVCPASWDEGGDALEPGMGIVGKI